MRTVWDDKEEKWYFCVVDVVEALTDSVNPTDYIKKMKKRDPELAKGWGQRKMNPNKKTNNDVVKQNNLSFFHIF